MGLEALSSEFVHSRRMASDHMIARKLAAAIAEFITRLERGALSKEVSEQLAKVLRTEQHLLACAEQAMQIARAQALAEDVADEKLMEGFSLYRAQVVSLMKMANPEEAGFCFADCELQLDKVQVAYDDVKALLLEAASELRVPIPVMIDNIDQNSRIRRMVRQMVKAMHHLSELSMIAEMRLPEPDSEPESEIPEKDTEGNEKQDKAIIE
jgi:phosphate:Na+ symporter